MGPGIEVNWKNIFTDGTLNVLVRIAHGISIQTGIEESRIQLEKIWYETENGDGSGNLASWDITSGIELGRISFKIYNWKECVSIYPNLNPQNPVTAFTIQ